jgi:uncharacterized protein
MQSNGQIATEPCTAMKMHRDNTARAHRISGYGAGFVSVDEETLTRSFILSPNGLITDWGPQEIADLDVPALEAVMRLSPTIVLLGSGAVQKFPPSSLLAPMLDKGIGVEIMTTPAACRTYNILVAEGRDVVAGLLIP